MARIDVPDRFRLCDRAASVSLWGLMDLMVICGRLVIAKVTWSCCKVKRPVRAPHFRLEPRVNIPPRIIRLSVRLQAFSRGSVILMLRLLSRWCMRPTSPACLGRKPSRRSLRPPFREAPSICRPRPMRRPVSKSKHCQCNGSLSSARSLSESQNQFARHESASLLEPASAAWDHMIPTADPHFHSPRADDNSRPTKSLIPHGTHAQAPVTIAVTRLGF